jgi:hypothetical protein
MSFQEEYYEQVAVVNWLRLQYHDILFTASAGGMRTSIGTAKKMKAMGYSRGTPDLWIMERRKGFSGLIIELKKEKGGVLSPEQKDWLKRLNERGFKAVCCKGFDEAMGAIKDYLK